MKYAIKFLLAVGVSMLIGCGKSESGGSPNQLADVPQIGADGTLPTCTSFTSSDQDSRALADISRMTRPQCQQNFQQLVMFYEDTKDMTDAQRRAYFQQQTQGISPAPPPPPPICSVIYEALRKCAVGQ